MHKNVYNINHKVGNTLMVLAYIIITVITSLACFTMGFLVLLKNINKNLNISFFVFTWVITIWGLINYLFYLMNSDLFTFKLMYASGGVVLLTAVPWILYLIDEKTNKYKVGFFYALAFLLITSPYWTLPIITSLKIGANNTQIFNTGPIYYILSTLVIAIIIYLFTKLFAQILTTMAKKVSTIICLGRLLFYFFIEFLFAIVLPLLNATPAMPFDTASSIVFVGFSTYAILKLEQPGLKAANAK